MIQTVSIKDTRDNLAELVERVAIAGEEFVVTKFGNPKAMLVPVLKGKMWTGGGFDKVFGVWRNREDIKNSATWVRKLRTKTSLRVRDE